MKHTVPAEILYSAYWYRSGTNRTMREHLQGIAEEALAMVALRSPVVLDIGCNDGTLLRSFPDEARRIGIDPSDVAAQAVVGCEVIRDIFPSPELAKLLAGAPCDIVTSIAMFYDIEDPVAFCRNIAAVLAPAGLWVFEMSYMPLMLEQTSYDTICHEHIEYYSLAVIENILSRAGLKIIRAELNDTNGGSICCYATHLGCFAYKDQAWLDGLKSLRQQEFDLELDTDKPYKHFQERINVHGEKLLRLLKEIKRQGKRIHIYGASTKGNTILQWCNIDNRLVDFAADRNPDKHGARTLGSDIPIISEEESRAMKPDYYFVLPWHFAEEFLERERAAMQGGTAMIFPLPEVKVYRWANERLETETW